MCFGSSLIASVREHYRTIKIHNKYLVVTQEFFKESKQVFSDVRHAKLLQMAVFKSEASN